MKKVVLNGSDCFCEAQKMPADTPGSMSGMNFNYAGKGDGWEISNLISSTVCLTSAARGLLVTEALLLSLVVSQVLIHVPDCKRHERNRGSEPRPGRFVHGGSPHACEYPLAFTTE